MLHHPKNHLEPHFKDICIIGGGFAGLSAAVFLDSLGYKITLLEKKPILGGRTYAFWDKKTDTWVDNGQHILIGAYHETLKLIENLGVTHRLTIQKKTEVPLIFDTKKPTRFTLPRLPVPFNLLVGLFKMKGFSLRDKLGFLKLGQALKKLKKTPDESLNQTVEEWLTNLRQSPYVKKNFWEPLTLATLNDRPQVASARMLATVLIKGFLSSQEDSRMILSKTNLNELLAKPARAYLEIRGQKIQTSVGVKKIHILDNKIQGLELDSGEMTRAHTYISALPFKALLRLIPEGFIESEPYFSNLTKLKNSPIISINLWFDRDIIPYPFVGVAGTQIHWYFNRNQIEDVSHPPYHYMGVVSGAYDLVEASREDILKIAFKELYELFPKARQANLIHSLVNKEKEATLSPQVGSEEFRPPQKSPFPNLYVIGDWTKTGYPATIESAVISARLAVDEIKKNKDL